MPRCSLPVCAMGDQVLPESKKEQVKTPLEPTQQELVDVIASEEAGFSETVDVGEFVRRRAVCDARGRSTVPYCK